MIIDGKKIAEHILQSLSTFAIPHGFLAIISVGDDSASASFIRQKQKAAEAVGIAVRVYSFDASITTDKLRREVGRIAKGSTCCGMLVQLPLPTHINKHSILNVVPPEKDVDVLGERALGALYTGRNPIIPPVVATVSTILQEQHVSLKEKTIAIVGPGFLVGKPIAVWALGKAREVIVLNRGSDFSLLKKADVVVCATGSAGLLSASQCKTGALIIDFGYGKDDDGVSRGDFNPDDAESHEISYTPTPGGTGPILVSCLLRNFLTLNQE